MGVYALAGSFFGGMGTAIGSVLDSLFGGKGSKPQTGAMQALMAPQQQQPAAAPIEEKERPLTMEERARLAEMYGRAAQQRAGVQALGPGLGGGGKTAPLPTVLGSPVNQAANAAGGQASTGINTNLKLDDLVQQTLGRALTGGTVLPERYYQQAAANLTKTLNAQAQQSRANLQSQLGQRGLMQSGLLARGVQGIESAKQEALASSLSQLQQSRLEAAMSERQWAVQAALQATAMRQQYELAARAAGLNEEQIRQANTAAMWESIAGLGVAAGSMWGSKGGNDAVSHSTLSPVERLLQGG